MSSGHVLPWLLLVLIFAGVCQCQEKDRIYRISEEESDGTFVGNIARDLNLAALIPQDVFDSLQYNILVGESATRFTIDQTNSDLFTNGRLDREQICRFESTCMLDIRIGARSEKTIRTYYIGIDLQDINDNAPQFNESELTMNIPESVTVGTVYTIPGALDIDRGGNNSIQSYSLVQGQDIFNLKYFQKLDGTSEVNLLVDSPLDRETRDFYSAVVVAKDGGDPIRTASLQINVNILDDNDNSPKFPKTHYDVQVGENTDMGALIIHLTAIDEDIGDNAKLRYRLSFHQDASVAERFEIDPGSGKLTAKVALTSGKYSIIVEAVDAGTPQKMNQTVVNVLVIDTENNPPVITLDTLKPKDPDNAYISESANPDAIVALVNVEDPDSGLNGEVQCYSQSAYFDLHDLKNNEYMVIVAKPLNREVTARYEVTLFCEDNGTPSLGATKVFDVIVEDENDNPPIFDNPDATVTIAEGNAINDVAMLMVATDEDEGNNAKVFYALLDDSDEFFHIPVGSNALSLSKSLDRETQDIHVITVLAKDGGQPANFATATVTVSVLDINDVAPKFLKSKYSFLVEEGLPAESFVGSVSAFDRDLEDGGDFSFLIPSRSGSDGKFKMSENGTLTTSTPLDRESVSSYSFVLEVRDHGRPVLTSTSVVEVTVLDINDNSPVFIFPSPSNSSVTIYLPIDDTGSIVTAQVVDADEGNNGNAYFFLQPGNASRVFRVDEVTGQVFALRSLDEDDTGSYNLTITATDSGSIPLSTTRSLYINLKENPVRKPVKDSESHTAVVVGLIAGTVMVAVLIALVVCLLRRRDKGKALKYLDTTNHHHHHQQSPRGNNTIKTPPPRVLDPSLLPSQYYDKQPLAIDGRLEDNNNDVNFTTVTSGSYESRTEVVLSANYNRKHSAPVLSAGYPYELDRSQSLKSSSDRGLLYNNPKVKATDDVATAGDKELNRVTSLRLQQAFQHISSIKSRLITPSDTSKPYEWREIHIPGNPGEFGSLSSRSTSSHHQYHKNPNHHNHHNNNNLDSGVGTDDDAVFHQHPQHQRARTKSPHRNHNGNTHFHQHHHHYHHHHNPSSNRHRFSSQPPSDTSADSYHPSISSLPNLCLKPGSDVFVFRPLSARSSESFPSETIEDQCTTTSGSYSISLDEMGHHGNKMGSSLLPLDAPFIQDVYV